MSERELHSSVRAEDWAPIYDDLMHGVVHAANNRIAALGGIVQLQEHKLSTPQETFDSLRDEVERLRSLMAKFRSLTVPPGARREPVRLGDALLVAAELLAHHAVARNWTITLTDEPPGVEPVLLWPADPLRCATLLLLAAGATRANGELFVTFSDADGMSVAGVVAANDRAAVEASRAFRALRDAAVAERGTLECSALGDAQLELRLSLPGLARAAQL